MASSFLLFLLILPWPPPAAAAAADDDDPSPPSLHSLSSPSFFSSNYHHMLHHFKIYIYPPQPTHPTFDFRSPPLLNTPPHSVDHLFFHSLSHSHFVTDVPDDAHLFFLPVSVASMARSLNVSVTRNLMMYVQQLREQYPYWQRTLGADHVLVSCHSIKRDFSRNVLELQKNAILVACDDMLAAGSNGEFYPHKDLAMPSYLPTALDFSIGGPASQERPYLLFMLSSRDSIQGKFADAYDLWTEDTAFMGDSESLDIPSYYKMLSSSRFCVTFDHTESNTSIVDGMRLGCVPVIVSNGYLFTLPFQDILDWQQFSLIVSMSQLSKLKNFLAEMPEDKYQALQTAARAASKHFEWNSPAKPYDAFHMLMYELWLRRHTVRYARRSS